MCSSASVSSINQKLYERADQAKAHAFTPNSHSNVGSAVLTAQGDVYTGANMEFTKFADHAEQVAINKALSAGVAPKDLVAEACAIRPGIIGSACGNCRQMMNDMNPEITEIFADAGSQLHESSTKEALPDAYHPSRPNPAGPAVPEGVTDPLMREAYEARSHAFVIRSQYPIGAAVMAEDGHIYRGVQMEASSFVSAAPRMAMANAKSEGAELSPHLLMAIVAGNTPQGELPKLTWDTLEAIHNVAPQATIVCPQANGTIAELTFDQLVQRTLQNP